MFSIGEHVIHPGQGVCTVMDFEDGPAPMIVLEARSGHAEALIDGYASLECDPFTERNSSLEESYFKGQLKLGAPETLRVAKTMRSRIRDAEEHARKPSSYYMRVYKEARRRSVEEFAVALGVSEQDADARLHAAAVAAGEIADN